MEKEIWKFQLKEKDNQTINMPVGAEILTVQIQNNIPCLWALVNPNAPTESILIEIFGTGHKMNYGVGADRKYIGTYQESNGALVFHVFKYIGI